MSSIQGEATFNFIKRNAGIIIVIGLLFSLASFFAMVATEERFKVTTDFLIVQDQMGTQDFYSLSKSAEYLGGILGEAVYSSVFIDEVEKTGKIESGFFPASDRERLKKWNRVVKVERSPQLGIMKVEVFDDNYENAMKLSEAISEIMTTKNYLFRGKVNLDVRILSGPVLEKNPGNSEIAMAVIGGFVIGAFLKMIHLYFVFLGGASARKDEDEYLESLIQQERYKG
ncbi:MAG: hypothetical protein PHH24_00380 [Candidatus Moranbacteria bacterium]|jgi:hypothetical protein|nr:hypothetical protein [Candidatus Moranbacteria bacterium]MDD5652186.1 hypothetical protein [Candidatus Moranbacteria bacterium]MDX9855688.1 hypothetical protein [Candidatus Moranbacteria bacterium]